MTPQQAFYFYRLRDNQITEFCVANARDPKQYVESKAPDGSTQLWESRWEGDLLVFHCPDGHNPGDGLLWFYDRRIQIGQAMPLEELERQALRCRVSTCG
jgi:hypothetical protein